ncbi:MAG: flagellar M-ring protein FliF, partial [Gammaproteobacteria bacterium]|nr:flagellar M-ring protein FliF [Gammaproteobacteria bacterium]
MAEATYSTENNANPAKNLVDIPAVRQGLLLAGIAAAVAIGIATVLWTRAPDYSLLYSNLADRDAGEIVNALMAANIPHELEASSGAIMVPADRKHEARLLLASNGLPQGSGLGFELIGEEKGLGVSQFMESARYQHMLETELVRTISNMRPVKGARVHLAIPKQSVFVRDRRSASASVMVDLYPGRRLEDSQVAAVINLVASSIPDLEAGDITVVDQQGRLLTEAGGSSDLALTAKQFDYKTRVEDSYAARIETLLAPLAGIGKVRAQVNAQMNFTVTESTQEKYDPANTAVRSEQSSNQVKQGDALANGGIPGALSNQPPDTGNDTPVEATNSSSSTSATRNFEIDRTVSHIRQQTGVIEKLSVAVIVDDGQTVADDGTVTSVPRSPEELERMTTLAREAVGFDAARGDSVNVVSAPFTAPETVEAIKAPWWEMPLISQVIRQLGGVVLLLGLILGLLRPTVR